MRDYVILGLDSESPPAQKDEIPFVQITVDLEREEGLATLPDGIYSASLTPEENQRLAEIIRETIEKDLTPPQFHVLKEHLAGKKQTEIGATLGYHQSTVSQHLTYAKRKILRKIMYNFPQLMIKTHYEDFNI